MLRSGQITSASHEAASGGAARDKAASGLLAPKRWSARTKPVVLSSVENCISMTLESAQAWLRTRDLRPFLTFR